MSDNESCESVNPAGDPVRPCPDCGGAGSVVLLVTRRTCERCGGAGRLYPPPPQDGFMYSIAWGDEPAGGPT